MMAIMDLCNRTPTPTIAQRASPFSGYSYYDYCLTLPGVEPKTIRLQTGSFTTYLMSGVVAFRGTEEKEIQKQKESKETILFLVGGRE